MLSISQSQCQLVAYFLLVCITRPRCQHVPYPLAEQEPILLQDDHNSVLCMHSKYRIADRSSRLLGMETLR
ncbi:hypothetical protein BD309DRAFT_48793 [Dichomitus squalens]|uniref:Uncharacterized protein n=1 Tax=Dichomitus squalens TaxID=114155 RepID=A0A4Q9NVP0_9APHY|nr:hypothetical protein BD309DRAFT_48793 [Dichomitus squalens]TBU60114.1 hypothetical protein BD310DRAFT_347383 [Dichomitus squalens]